MRIKRCGTEKQEALCQETERKLDVLAFVIARALN